MSKGKVSIFAERLAKMQNSVAGAMADYTPGGMKVPDSIYMAKEQCELGESKSSGNLMVTRTFTIIEGEFKGLKIWDHLVLEKKDRDTGERSLSDMGIQQCRRWVELHGIQFPEDDLVALEEVVNAINDAAPECRIRSKTTVKGDDEYTHATILEVLSEISLDSAPVESPAAPKTRVAPAPAPGKAPAPKVAAKAPAAPKVPAKPVVEEVDEQESEIVAMTRAELKSWLAENVPDYKITLKVTEDQMRDKVRELLSSDTAEPEEVTEEGEDTSDLLVFCASQGIEEAKEGMSIEEIVGHMSTYQFVEEEMTAEELDMLVTVGVPEANIVRKPVAVKKPGLARPGLKK